MMTNILKKIIPLLLICAVAGCNKAGRESKLIVGVSAEYPPFEYQENGKIVGYDIDLVQLIAEALKEKVEIRDMPFASLIPALNSGRLDMVVASMSITPEREASVDFSEVYYYNTITVVYRKDAPITALHELYGKKLGVQLGSTMEQFAKEIARAHPATHITALDVNMSLIEDLKNGRLDGVLVEAAQAVGFTQKNPTLAYKVVKTEQDGYAIAFRQHSPLRAQINRILSDLKITGTLNSLQQRWIPEIFLND